MICFSNAGIPWTENEHRQFLLGLEKCGKGHWLAISQGYVPSRTPSQVASHAQKYFIRQTNPTAPERRRPSLFDIKQDMVSIAAFFFLIATAYYIRTSFSFMTTC